MESLIILIPIVLTTGTCIGGGLLINRLYTRIQLLEQSIANLITYQHTPLPSAPPGYGYQWNNPQNNLNVV